MKRYVAIALGIATALIKACTPSLTDFTFPFPPVPADTRFATFIGPGIWEIVPKGGQTSKGAVDYLVEALDENGRTIAAYQANFERAAPGFARDKQALSELVTILIATERQMQNPVPRNFAANPRYMIPSAAVYVRLTVDPDNRIREPDEKNNVFLMRLPEVYHGF